MADSWPKVSKNPNYAKKLIKEAVFINLEKIPNSPLKFDLAKNFLKSENYSNRHYDPTIGHWTTKDPIGFAGGDTNLYNYVGGDPMSYVDPSGLFFEQYFARNLTRQQ